MFYMCDDDLYAENPFNQIPEDPTSLPYPDEDLYNPFRYETGDDWIWNENDG